MYQPGDGSDHAANRDALDKVSGDRAFTCPTIELTDTFTDAGINGYFYYLTHRASSEVWPPWMGVIHGAEIQVGLVASFFAGSYDLIYVGLRAQSHRLRNFEENEG